MKTQLLKNFIGYLLMTGLLLLAPYKIHSQQLKTTQQDQVQKGHALYKQSKIYDSKSGPVGVKPKRVGDRALDRVKYQYQMLANPNTGEIPANIRLLESSFSDKIRKRSQELSGKTPDVTSKRRYSYFKNRGPGNVGGRTRALAVDMKNENILFAGGVSGGLWRSTNKGESWKKVTKRYQSPSITAIVQDPRKGKSKYWYYASGERFGNSASAGGAFYAGTGIYKSNNNGRSWYRLSNSNDNDVTSFSSLDLINSIAIHPKTGHLYVATFDGVLRSTDGGRSFDEVLASDFDVTTEIMITSTGVLYATVATAEDVTSGYFTSTDGTNWTNITPTGVDAIIGRTVMANDPINCNTVYFFSQDLRPTNEALLLKYNAEAAESEQWTDLTANLPTNIGGRAGDLNLQGGYNMIIKVHPTNTDLIVLGGTNLYRSTDAFTTQVGRTGWVGGYTATADNFALYPNHHPDQHNFIFFPSNPNTALSANDGGIQFTEDITDTTAVSAVNWTSLNNKYITTQPYAVSFDPSANSDDLLAGFQDNGIWFTNSKNINTDWIEDFGGDGSFNAIADGGLSRYVSSQGGNLFRFNFDEAGEFVSWARITPAGATDFGFIAPFILDHNNDNIMYMPAGDRIWRNNNLDEIPLFSNAASTVNWVEQQQTATTDGSTVTALDVSTFPEANKLYYGSNTGQIYRVDNANIDNQTVTDIAAGKGLPAGNVNNIYVDPTDANRVFVSFSNYGIISLFMTDNAGETWTNISGNLEENADGTGNGPSVRWFAMNGNNDGYWVGTSTGLYYTYRLRGAKTYWFKEPFRIGNNVVAQVKTRADGFIAAAIHGNGVYSAKFCVHERPTPQLSRVRLLADIIAPTNSDPIEVDISNVFEHAKGRNIQIEITNANESLVQIQENGDNLVLVISPDMEGNAAIALIATSGVETVSEGFTVRVVEPAIYEQLEPVVSSAPSQNFLDFGATVQTADDFIVPEDAIWKVNRVMAFGGVNNGAQLTEATVVIFADNNGTPGDLVYESGPIIPTSEPTDTNMNLTLPEEIELTGGNYWLSVYANLAFTGSQFQWFWNTQAQVLGNENVFRDPADLFGTGATTFTPLSAVFGGEANDHVFQIFGLVTNVGEASEATGSTKNNSNFNSPEIENLVSISPKIITTVWPNPATSKFHFNIAQLETKTVTAKVYNLGGQLLYVKESIKDGDSFSWDASKVPSGLYIVKLNGQGINKSFKIVKE